MVMQVRLATEKDVPAIAQNYVGILTESPLFIHFYENVTEEDYRIHREALLRRTLKNAAQRMYVAVHDDGECVGSIIYSVVGLESQGFDKDPALPDLPAPRGTDLSRLNSYFGKLAEWRAELLQNYGPHISRYLGLYAVELCRLQTKLFRPTGGDKLFVVKYGRNVGAATALCLQVKDDALKLGVPVFFDASIRNDWRRRVGSRDY